MALRVELNIIWDSSLNRRIAVHSRFNHIYLLIAANSAASPNFKWIIIRRHVDRLLVVIEIWVLGIRELIKSWWRHHWETTSMGWVTRVTIPRVVVRLGSHGCHLWKSGLRHLPLIWWIVEVRGQSYLRWNKSLRRIPSHLVLIISSWLHWILLVVFGHRHLHRPLEWLSRRSICGASSHRHGASIAPCILELPLEMLWNNIHLLVILLLGSHELLLLRMALI
jgi:hypothetical protein